MPIPRVRLTVRRVLMALALVGLIVGAEAVRRRVVVCRVRAHLHAREQRRLAAARDDRLRRAKADPALSAVARFDTDRHQTAIAWHAERERVALRAAWRPWTVLPPDSDQPPWPPIPAELYPVAKPVASPSRTAIIDAFLFHPVRYPEGNWTMADPAVETASFRASDGTLLNGWFAAARHPRAVVLYCEGNAGNITARRWVLELFRDRMNASVLIFDYRGYGRSEGTPSQAGILQDARAARRWLAERTGVRDRDLVLVGHSLGGAVAVDLAARDGARGLVLENTFSSLAELTELHFGRLARLLVTNDLDSASKIGSYAGPLLQTHGTADTVVPYELGRRLFDTAKGPRRFVTVAGGEHNDPPSAKYLDALERFLKSLPSR